MCLCMYTLTYITYNVSALTHALLYIQSFWHIFDLLGGAVYAPTHLPTHSLTLSLSHAHTHTLALSLTHSLTHKRLQVLRGRVNDLLQS